MSDALRDESGRFAPRIASTVGADPVNDDTAGADPVNDDWDGIVVMVDTANMAEYWRGPIDDFRESNGETEHVCECLDRIEEHDHDFAEVAGMFHLRRACHFDQERKVRGEIVPLGTLVAQAP